MVYWSASAPVHTSRILLCWPDTASFLLEHGVTIGTRAILALGGTEQAYIESKIREQWPRILVSVAETRRFQCWLSCFKLAPCHLVDPCRGTIDGWTLIKAGGSDRPRCRDARLLEIKLRHGGC